MEYNNDFRHDLKVGQVKEKEIGEIFQNKTIEVKTDFKASKTGNLFIEYESRNKKSGISTSESDFYCFAIDSIFILITSKDLKYKCRKYLNTDRDIRGGDNNTSKGILLPIIDLLPNKNR